MLDVSVKTDFYVATGWPPVEERPRILKYGQMFAVFDRYGNIRDSGLGEHGIYYKGTRYLSRLALFLGETPPLFLSSAVRADNSLFSADLTNLDRFNEDDVVLRRGTVHLVRSRLLWEGVCYEQLRLTNYGAIPVHLPVRIEFGADFADIFEVRGVKRAQRGQRLPEIVGPDRVQISYRGLDNVVRRCTICCSPMPHQIAASHVLLTADLAPRETVKFQFTVQCEESKFGTVEIFDQALAAVSTDVSRAQKEVARVRSSNREVDNWLHRSFADVHMMTVGNPEAGYPYAGVPWFSTVFGRDGIITALECLWLNPRIARGVLQFLATTQAQDVDSEAEAEPGKIVHETRDGEMARLGEVPFRRYYGSVDATPLFVILAGAFYNRTGDLDFVRALWPHIELALSWIDIYGDRDGDGFVEYQRQSAKGLVQQGWKDSNDSVFHADGSLAEAPIALCEVQAYVYGAKRAASALAVAMGDNARGKRLESEAAILKERFEKAFWCEELSTYALALDGHKQPCRVRTSNAGHCLYTEIASSERARRVANTLLSEDSFSGWGVRTVSSNELRYNPISYHNGSVWPHDSAIFAAGVARYGFTHHAVRLFDTLFEASGFFEMNRLPELLCGLHRRPGEGPTLYPVACSPQAWSAGAAFLLLKAGLGLSIDCRAGRIVFNKPHLPRSTSWLQIEKLVVGDASIDLILKNGPTQIDVEIANKVGQLDVTVCH
ncbi:MAG TPA: amylo-alpha-1,6-glucosidase [Terriglobales bacterium]|nr:amylo-alpha-1,6-glucosidase [Terriglobales bacterium]